MKIFFRLFLYAVLLAHYVFFSLVTAHPISQVQDIDKISEVNKYIDNKTMVLFDIDNTILTADQSLGSDQWFDYYVKTKVEQGNDKLAAVHATLDKWMYIHQYTKVKPIENNTVEVINYAQAKTPYVYVLTARSGSTYTMSSNELSSLGLSFDKMNHVDFKIPQLQLHETDEAVYKNGLILAGLTGKGRTLKEFIKKSGIDIKNLSKVIFIDDKKHNVDDVARAADELGVNFLGLRYAAADHDVKNFSSEIANKQLSFLQRCKRLISDTFAKVVKLKDDCAIGS